MGSEMCIRDSSIRVSLEDKEKLERLEELASSKLIRIGLSATIAPLEEVAKYLVGYDDNGNPRPCVIVDARFSKPFKIDVIMPVKDIVNATASELNTAIYRVLADIIKKYRTTLVFTNTRSATERVVYKLRAMFKNDEIVNTDDIEAHHSSLSRHLRLNVEDKLKKGLLKAVVCSTSLELGIDIGFIDAVVLLSSPKSVSRLLQRVGRSGHSLNRVSIGKIIVVDRDDLVECTVLAKAAIDRKIDRVKIPRNALDVLAQHIVGMSLERKWSIEEAYRLVKRSYCYKDLTKEDFMSVLRYLAGYYGELENYKVYGKIWLDEDEGVFGRKRKSKSRMIYFMNLGTIPDESKVYVFLEDGKYIGELEEQFLQILEPGDIFILGGRTYQFIRSRGSLVYVRSVEGQRPTVPSWFSEMLPLTYDSALLVGKFRREVHTKINELGFKEAIKWVSREYHVDWEVAKNICEYILEQSLFTGGLVPSDNLIVVEIFDEHDRRNIIFHTLFGRKTNDALSRAYAKALSKMLNENVRITITDNGFMLTIPGHPMVDVNELIRSVRKDNVRNLIMDSLKGTELLKRKFRHCAVRAFMILRRYMNREKSAHKLQLSAQNILNVVEGLKGFPILKETYREILEEHMDVSAAEEVLEKIENGEIKVEVIGPNSIPSPFAHSIIAQGYSDIVLMEDRKALLQRLHNMVIECLIKEGKLKTTL